MTTSVSGPLRLVTDVPATLVQVSVRAPRPRPHAGGMVVDFTTPASVADGVVEFPCVPGPAVLMVSHAGVPQVTVPLVVPDKASATLEECIRAGELADTATRSELEDLARRIVEGVDTAEQAAQTATGQAEIATEQAGIASDAAATATEQAGVASEHADAAAASAGEAAVSEQSAKASEQAAKRSETNAKASEERVATIAGSTRWVGTKLEVNGQLSPDLKGDLPVVYSTTAPEDKNVIWVNPDEELPDQTGISSGGGASGPVSWESVTDKPSEFNPAAHTHAVADVDGLDEALGGKASITHSHSINDVEGLQSALDSKVDSSEVSVDPAASSIPLRTSAGTINAASPTYPEEVATKGYVDSYNPQVQVVKELPDDPLVGGVYILTGQQDGAFFPATGVYVGAAQVWPSKPTVTISGSESAQTQLRDAIAAHGGDYATVTELPFNLDTSQVTDMDSMFDGCSSLESVPEMDTSRVIDMSFMFAGCSALTSVPDLDTSNVEFMSATFWDCSSLTSVPDLDTSQATDMSFMFSGCSSLVSVPDLDTRNVTIMSSMFSGCSSLTAVPDLDTSQVVDAAYMFVDCESLTDGQVRLIRQDGTKPDERSFMIEGSGLTREPFFLPDGTPID